MGKRFFEVVSKYKNKDIKLPRRATDASAGYDLASAETVTLPSLWNHINPAKFKQYKSMKQALKANGLRPALISTGLKVHMPLDNVLIIANRSSNPLKRGLVVPNSIGVIDADYYNNPSNEGEIFVQLVNVGPMAYTIHKGDRIAQAMFMPYLTVDNDKPVHSKRLGGFGSSGK